MIVKFLYSAFPLFNLIVRVVTFLGIFPQEKLFNTLHTFHFDSTDCLCFDACLRQSWLIDWLNAPWPWRSCDPLCDECAGWPASAGTTNNTGFGPLSGYKQSFILLISFLCATECPIYQKWNRHQQKIIIYHCILFIIILYHHTYRSDLHLVSCFWLLPCKNAIRGK